MRIRRQIERTLAKAEETLVHRSSVQQRIDDNTHTCGDDGSEAAANKHASPECSSVFRLRGHQWHHGEYWKRELFRELGVGLESAVFVLQQCDKTQTQRKPDSHPHQGHAAAVRTE